MHQPRSLDFLLPGRTDAKPREYASRRYISGLAMAILLVEAFLTTRWSL